MLPVRGAADTGQDALTLRYSIQRRWPPAVAGDDGGDALGVEAGHQSGDGVAGLAPRRLRRLREGVPVGHSQQSLSAGDLSGGPGQGAGDLVKLGPLLIRERAKRLLLFSWHNRPPGGEIKAVYPLTLGKATLIPIDPLEKEILSITLSFPKERVGEEQIRSNAEGIDRVRFTPFFCAGR